MEKKIEVNALRLTEQMNNSIKALYDIKVESASPENLMKMRKNIVKIFNEWEKEYLQTNRKYRIEPEKKDEPKK